MIRLLLVVGCLALSACSGGSDGVTSPGGAGNEPPGGNPSPGDGDPPGGSDPTDGSERTTIDLLAGSFDPSDVTVEAGSTVIWSNTSSIAHTITPQNHSQWTRVETNREGEALEVTFSAPGTYEYFCEFHAGMTGEVTVE